MFTDDTYLVILAVNSRSCVDEISHIETWVSNNNLKLLIQGIWGMEVPSGVQGQSPSGGGGRSWAKHMPQKLTTYFEKIYRKHGLMRPLH